MKGEDDLHLDQLEVIKWIRLCVGECIGYGCTHKGKNNISKGINAKRERGTIWKEKKVRKQFIKVKLPLLYLSNLLFEEQKEILSGFVIYKWYLDRFRIVTKGRTTN